MLKWSFKAQAALEFLTTYGWAFLVILIMIGALAYFGVLSPSKILPNRCNMGAEFQCLDYAISLSAGTFRLRLKSNVGEPIDVSGWSLQTESTTPYSCTTVLPTFPISSWKPGEIKDVLWSTCTGGALASGSKGKVLVTLQYNPVSSGPNYAKNVTGDIYATVQ